MITQIMQAFLPNIEIISVALILIVLALIAKIGSGVYLNVFTLKFDFSWKIFFEGVAKGLIFALSIYAASLVASGLPLVASAAGLLFIDGAQVLSTLFPIAVIIVASYKLLKDAYANYKKTLNVTDDEIAGMVKERTLG